MELEGEKEFGVVNIEQLKTFNHQRRYYRDQKAKNLEISTADIGDSIFWIDILDPSPEDMIVLDECTLCMI